MKLFENDKEREEFEWYVERLAKKILKHEGRCELDPPFKAVFIRTKVPPKVQQIADGVEYFNPSNLREATNKLLHKALPEIKTQINKKKGGV